MLDHSVSLIQLLPIGIASSDVNFVSFVLAMLDQQVLDITLPSLLHYLVALLGHFGGKKLRVSQA
jgi:hypothetical protein